MYHDTGSFTSQLMNSLWPNGDTDLGQHWSDKGLLPYSTKPLPEPVLTSPFLRFCSIHLRAFSQVAPVLLFCEISLKIVHLKFLPHLPGANELKDNTKNIWANGYRQPDILVNPQRAGTELTLFN